MKRHNIEFIVPDDFPFSLEFLCQVLSIREDINGTLWSFFKSNDKCEEELVQFEPILGEKPGILLKYGDKKCAYETE